MVENNNELTPEFIEIAAGAFRLSMPSLRQAEEEEDGTDV